MTEMLVFSRLDDLNQVAESWDRLRKRQPRFFPNFDGLSFYLAEVARDFRVLAIKNGNEITCLACFVYERARKRYTVGERKLFSLPIRQVSLFGSAMLGDFDAATLTQFLDVVSDEFSFDLLKFGEVPLDSPLYVAIHAAGFGFVVTSPSRKNSLRWLIRLPESFDQYMATLSTKSRQMVRQAIRKFEKEYKYDFQVIHRPDQVDAFLRDGEAISRLTYQWNVGQRLCNDDATRRIYMHRARKDQLRCYIVYIEGKPCAFARGELVDGTYNYETPGFDPQYSKFSPGTVMLIWAIRDLIENTNCEMFDFGEGGDEVGYKSRLGNVSMNCTSLELGRRSKPYSVALILLQEGLTAVKNVASRVIGDSAFRQRLKKAIRKYGVN